MNHLLNLKTLFVAVVMLIATGCNTPKKEQTTVDKTALTRQINTFMDEWHANAANADEAYFHKIAPMGIYIGTDKSELWVKDEFYSWSKKYFERGSAWAFKATGRNIYFSDDYHYAWFDELLDTHMGVCRASGVVKKTNGSWEICHYHLSVTLPNELMKEFVKMVNRFEAEQQK